VSSDKSLTVYDDSSVAGGCWPGGLCALVVGVVPLALLTKVWSVLPDRWFRTLVITVIVIGAGLGMLAARHRVHTATLTAHRIVLASAVATRTVNIADLKTVSVTHAGDTDHGYTRTTLHLILADGCGVDLVGSYNPKLAESVGRVLGAKFPVEETRRELDPPV
jgi:hypothetical protein